MKHLVSTVLALLLAFATAAPASADECAGVRMPDRTSVAGRTLLLNGMGVREATVFNVDVYVAGLYAGSRTRNPNAILAEDQAKHLVLSLVRDVSREEMVDALQSGLRRAAGANAAQLRPRMQQMARLIPALGEGDSIVFTYVPDQGMTVTVNGRRRGTIEGGDFARAFYAIWLGNDPPNAGLKSGLLGGSCG